MPVETIAILPTTHEIPQANDRLDILIPIGECLSFVMSNGVFLQVDAPNQQRGDGKSYIA